MKFWRQTAAVLMKDLLTEYRTKDILTSMLLFGLLVILMFQLRIRARFRGNQEVRAGAAVDDLHFRRTPGHEPILRRQKRRTTPWRD